MFADGMESMQLGILVLDTVNHRVMYRNTAAQRLLKAADVHSYHGVNALLSQHGCDYDDLLEADAKQESVTVGDRLVGYSFYRSRDFVWVFLRDITERSHLESIAESVQQMNSLGIVFSAVRHELGNPIHSIKAAVSVLRSGLHRFSQETVADYLLNIENELTRAEELLRSLRRFSLSEEPDLRPIDLPTCFVELMPLLEPDLHARWIQLEVASDIGSAPVMADARALRQILINLVANAADATEGLPSPWIKIRAVRGDALTTVMVEDNGKGIPEHLLPLTFTPFFTTKEHGTGLGLIIVKKMVTAMNGTVWIDRLVPRGTRVSFTLRNV